MNYFLYHIDRCDLWGLIREINFGILPFFPAGTTFTQLYIYVPCCVLMSTIVN